MDFEDAIPMETANDFAAWLEKDADDEPDVWVSIHKKGSGKQTVTFGELLAVALCYGWIDVKAKRIDEERYAIRFTPRRPGSNWSARNRETARRLLVDGKMTERGKALLPPDL
jgi:uncharacterized protein YdeI (YjbR/CyaY-like superfamily)